MKADMESIPHRIYIRHTGTMEWRVSIPGVLRIETTTYMEALAVAQPYLDVLALCIHQYTQPSFATLQPAGDLPSEASA